MRMENERVENELGQMEQKYKEMLNSLASAMADLNNV